MPSPVRPSTGRVLLAGLFLMVFGYLWYGVLFQQLQLDSHGYTAADYAGNSPLWYAGGGLISLVIAIGLALMVRADGAVWALAGARSGVRASLCFGLPLVTYPFVYSPHHEFGLYVVGVAHIVIGWTTAGAILGGAAASGATSPRPAQA